MGWESTTATMAAAILATQDAALAERLDAWRARQTDAVAATVED